jgi:hypothetical protein
MTHWCDGFTNGSCGQFVEELTASGFNRRRQWSVDLHAIQKQIQDHHRRRTAIANPHLGKLGWREGSGVCFISLERASPAIGL